MENESKEKIEKKEGVTIDLNDPKDVFDIIYNSKDIEDTKPNIIGHLRSLVDRSPLKDAYALLFLYDDAGQINRYTANQIYSALSEKKDNSKKDVLLILYSMGGLVEPAYLISKCCKEYANRFVVAIPRQAKSAATLLAMGADEIHMGLMSELGPIDPQVGRYPALGLGYAIESLASLCKRYPESSDMFAKYLSLSLNLQDLGYFERVSESAAQYAERLLKNKKLPSGQTPTSVAGRLVYSYKDHGFVIDKEEAESFLGKDFVKYNTDEYKLSDSIHKFLEWAILAFKAFKKKDFKIIGNLDSGISFLDRKEEWMIIYKFTVEY